MKKWVILLVDMTLIMAAAIRFYHLTEAPAKLNIDELSSGYNAYSILKTGRDEYGQFLPLTFRSLNDYRTGTLYYLTSLSEALFGVNDWAVRFPSVIFGLLGLTGAYFLVFDLAKRGETSGKARQLALLTVFLLALSPWQVVFSRQNLEPNIAAVLAVWWLFCLQRALFYSSRSWWMGSLGLLFLAVNSYHSYKLILPVFLAVVGIFYHRELWAIVRKAKLLTIMAALAITLPIIMMTIGGVALERARGISILTHGEIIASQAVERISFDRNIYGGLLANLLDNRRILYGLSFASSYLRYFSFGFLFSPLPPESFYALSNVGLLNMIDLPLVLMGSILTVLASWPKRVKWLILFGWLLVPVAAGVVVDDFPPSPSRVALWNYLLVFLAAYGLLWVTQRSRVLLMLAIMIVMATMMFMLHSLFVLTPRENKTSLVDFYEQVFSQAGQRLRQAGGVVIVDGSLPSSPYIHYLWLSKMDPERYWQSGGTSDGSILGGNNNIGNYLFRDSVGQELAGGPLREKAIYVAGIGQFPQEIRDKYKLNRVCLKGEQFCVLAVRAEELNVLE